MVGILPDRIPRNAKAVEAAPVVVPDSIATVLQSLGIDPEEQNQANGRPIRPVEKAASRSRGGLVAARR